jgi:hypothetical protein
MWTSAKKVIKDCTTENNGESYCAFRVAAMTVIATGFPTFLACTIYTVVRNGTFDMCSFGTALCAILGGCGVLAGGVALKARTEI